MAEKGEKTMTFTKEKLAKFVKAQRNAEAKEKESFVFCGTVFHTKYARYLIEYLAKRLSYARKV